MTLTNGIQWFIKCSFTYNKKLNTKLHHHWNSCTKHGKYLVSNSLQNSIHSLNIKIKNLLTASSTHRGYHRHKLEARITDKGPIADFIFKSHTFLRHIFMKAIDNYLKIKLSRICSSTLDYNHSYITSHSFSIWPLYIF